MQKGNGTQIGHNMPVQDTKGAAVIKIMRAMNRTVDEAHAHMNEIVSKFSPAKDTALTLAKPTPGLPPRVFLKDTASEAGGW